MKGDDKCLTKDFVVKGITMILLVKDIVVTFIVTHETGKKMKTQMHLETMNTM